MATSEFAELSFARVPWLSSCWWASASGCFFSNKVPSSFLPDEDQGYLYVNLQLPSAASLERTDHVAAKIENILVHTPGVQSTTSVLGFSLLSYTRSTYNAFFFVTLEAVGRSQDQTGTVSGDQSAVESRTQPTSGGDRF